MYINLYIEAAVIFFFSRRHVFKLWDLIESDFNAIKPHYLTACRHLKYIYIDTYCIHTWMHACMHILLSYFFLC